MPSRTIGNRSLVLFDRGDEVVVQAGEQGIRFLLVSGKPLEEPVAWYGPIVMNTEAELRQAVVGAAKRDVHTIKGSKFEGLGSRARACHAIAAKPRRRIAEEPWDRLACLRSSLSS